MENTYKVVGQSTDIGHLYDLDDDGWLQHDGRIGRAADNAMKAVDSETVGLFRKYGLEMPADFARERDTRWKREVRVRRPFDEELSHTTPEEFADRRRDVAARLAQSVADREEVKQAILATDARRSGALPKDYYRIVVDTSIKK